MVKTEKGSFECTCKPGFIGDGLNCQLSDPCLGGEHNCRAPQTCIATSGSGQYKCVCMGGYIALPGSPNECVDLDECTMDINDCSETEECVNTVGGYHCKCKENCSVKRPNQTFSNISHYLNKRLQFICLTLSFYGDQAKLLHPS